MVVQKAFHEGFARFFETPSREALRDLLKHSVGETDHIDFKAELPEKTTGYSSTRTLSLEEHLNQLKLLYKEIPRTIKITKERAFDQLNAFARIASDMQNYFGNLYETKANPDFPSEDYQQFILHLIDMKKARIKQEIEV